VFKNLRFKKGARRVILDFIILKVSSIRKVRIAFPTDLPHNLFSLLLATVGLVFISSGRWRGGVGLLLLR